MAKLESVEALRQVIGTPSDLVPHKIHRELNARAIAFIARSPMLMLSTADARNQPTVSPKGDQPGFVHVADSRTLLIPERKGNKLIFSLTNILANPQVGLIFMIPGTGKRCGCRVGRNCWTIRICGQRFRRGAPTRCW